MPTLLLIDCSFSMLKSIKNNEASYKNALTKRDIAQKLVKSLVENISRLDKSEQICLVSFSSITEIICEFTTDINKIICSLDNIKSGSRTSVDALNFISSYILAEYGCESHIKIILITDDMETLDQESSIESFLVKLKLSSSNNAQQDSEDFTPRFPFPFANTFDIICLKSDAEVDNLKVFSETKMDLLSELLKTNNQEGSLHYTKTLDPDYIEKEFSANFVKKNYQPFVAKLIFADYICDVEVNPKPVTYRGYQSYRYVERKINDSIDIIAFVGKADLIIPPTVSRHLLYPFATKQMTEEDIPFAYVLHGALKQDNSVAIVRLADDDWYGAVYCSAEPKNDPTKKPFLMMSIYVPGAEIIENALSKVYCKVGLDKLVAQGQELRSYNKTCISWLKSTDIISDVQKIIRHAKKLPEKTALFYKELNRIRRAALSYGFYDLLEGITRMLEREAMNMATNHEALLQINNAIFALRLPIGKDYRTDINPLILK